MRGSPVIDARTGEAHGSGDRLHGALARFAAMGGQRLDGMARAREAWNASRIDSALAPLRASGARADAFPLGGGIAMARQLEHVYAEVVREEYPRRNAFLLFPIDGTVPAGARTHTVRRLHQSGEAAVYRKGQEIPRVGMAQQEEEFPVRHVVDSFSWSIFEQASASFANIQIAAEFMRTAREIIEERVNRLAWFGSTEHGLYGVLTYPWVEKKVVVTPFTDATAPDLILAELNAIANRPAAATRATFAPNVLAMSPRLRDYLSTKPRSTVADTTILQHFLMNNAYIERVEAAHELQGAGPGGTDAIVAYRDDRMGITLVVPEGFTPLPMQMIGLEDITYCYMSYGGVIMRNPANNLIAYVTAPTI